jgi:tetratricopeptide (TPR) repeat protein
MRRPGKVILLLSGAVIMIGSVGFLGYIAYRDVTVDMALSEAKNFREHRKPATVNRADPVALSRLRPHPLSSPLHNRQFDEAIAGARKAYEAGDYIRAIALNTEALNVHPSQDLVWLLLTRRGDCYLQKGDSDKALADYDQAALLGELDPHTYVNQALALRRIGKSVEAMKDLDAAVTSNPRDALIYAGRATILAEDGNLEGALTDYLKALEFNPENLNWRISCAEIYLRQNDNQKAITQSTIALQTNAHWALPYVTRAKAYARLGMNAEALADLNTADQLNTTEQAAALNTVAWCRATCPESVLRDGKKAIAEAMKACELDQWRRWTFVDTLAAAYAEAGDFDSALKYQQQAVKAAPAQSEAVSGMRKRLERYKQHKPFRDEPSRK